MRRIVFFALAQLIVWPALAGDLERAKQQLARELSECAAYYYTLATPQEVEESSRHRLILAGRRAKALSASISSQRQALTEMEGAMDAMLVSMRFDWSRTEGLRERFERRCDYLIKNPGRRLLTWVDRYTDQTQRASRGGAGTAGVVGNVSSAVAAAVPLPTD
jgi:hypothetical protein